MDGSSISVCFIFVICFLIVICFVINLVHSELFSLKQKNFYPRTKKKIDTYI